MQAVTEQWIAELKANHAKAWVQVQDIAPSLYWEATLVADGHPYRRGQTMLEFRLSGVRHKFMFSHPHHGVMLWKHDPKAGKALLAGPFTNGTDPQQIREALQTAKANV